MGIKNKAYLEGRLKLLESGGQVIKKAFGAGGGQGKWEPGVGDKRASTYNDGGDF